MPAEEEGLDVQSGAFPDFRMIRLLSSAYLPNRHNSGVCHTRSLVTPVCYLTR